MGGWREEMVGLGSGGRCTERSRNFSGRKTELVPSLGVHVGHCRFWFVGLVGREDGMEIARWTTEYLLGSISLF